jgi:hypothetical protein
MDFSQEIVDYIIKDDLKNNSFLFEIVENDEKQGIEMARKLILNQGGVQGIPKINYFKSAIQRFIIDKYNEIPTIRLIRELRIVLRINERSVKKLIREAVNIQYNKDNNENDGDRVDFVTPVGLKCSEIYQTCNSTEFPKFEKSNKKDRLRYGDTNYSKVLYFRNMLLNKKNKNVSEEMKNIKN